MDGCLSLFLVVANKRGMLRAVLVAVDQAETLAPRYERAQLVSCDGETAHRP